MKPKMSRKSKLEAQNTAGPSQQVADKKNKDVKSAPELVAEESDEIPIIQMLESTWSPSNRQSYMSALPCYESVYLKFREDPITMEELDRLQPELEQLLSAACVRLRSLKEEIAAIDELGEGYIESKIIHPAKKRKLNDDKDCSEHTEAPKLKEANANVTIKSEEESSDEFVPEPVFNKPDPSSNTIFKNDTPDKFWAFTEQYCRDITPQDIKSLEQLLDKFDASKNPVKIPPLGKHYTEKWATEDLSNEKDLSNMENAKKKSEFANEAKAILKKANLLCGRERSLGPLVQRLVSALMEENMSGSNNGDHYQEIPKSKLDEIKVHRIRNHGLGLERSLRSELEKVGFLELEDEDGDEILTEIKKCEEELQTISAQNVSHIQTLIDRSKKELECVKIKQSLKELHGEIVELSRRAFAARLKKKQLPKKDKEQAIKLVKDRESLINALAKIQ